MEEGTDINVVNPINNSTLLHYAVAFGQNDIAVYLIENGIEKDAADIQGDTPIMLAVYNGNQEIYDLLKEDANVYVLDAYGNSLLHLAASSGNINIYNDLIESGLDLNLKNDAGKTSIYYSADSETLQVIMDYMGINTIDEEFAKDLLFSAVSVNMVDYLIDGGFVDVNIVDEEGNNALNFAMDNGVTDVFSELIQKGIDVNHQNMQGNTVLHYCAYDNLTEYAQILLDANADKSIKNGEEKTAYEIAEQMQSTEVKELLGGN